MKTRIIALEMLMGGWSTEVELTNKHFAQLEPQARKDKAPFQLSLEEAWDVFLQQAALCSFSCIRLQFGKTPAETTAHLDRIDPKLGYVPGNVRWLHKDMARMKNDLTDFELYSWARKLMLVARSTGWPRPSAT